MRDLPRAPRQRERSSAARQDDERSLPGVPRTGFATQETRIRAPVHHFQRDREASRRLFREEQSRRAAPKVWAWASGGRPSGLRRSRSNGYYEDEGADQLPVVPPAPLLGAGRSAGQGPAQQSGILFQLPQGSDAEIVFMRKINTMSKASARWIRNPKRLIAGLVLLSVTMLAPAAAFGDKRKKNAEPKKAPVIDYSNIVWPNPPAIARIRYQAFYAAQKLSQVQAPNTKKQKWMDRLAGTQAASDNTRVLFQLAEPYGLAVDSKNNLYVADQKVGAIFIFNTETREAELIKNRTNAHFVRIIGLAMDDNDRLFVSDPGLHHILVFDASHKAEDVITDGMVEPGGLTLDRENRLLYVADVALDQVLVYDADSFKLLRKIGTTGHDHELTTPGDLAKPTGVAVDKEGNLYVADTLNNRIEVFDADGVFIRTWGKNGDVPGYFARPKGVAIDSDGHVWVADGMQDRVQVFTNEGQLLIVMGGHGLLPGQYQGLVSIASDNKRNRIYTSEIYPGRVQEFRYVTDAEFDQLRAEREKLRADTLPKPKEGQAAAAVTPSAAVKPPDPK